MNAFSFPNMSQNQPVDFAEISEKSAEMVQKFMEEQGFMSAGAATITRSFLELADRWLANPEQFFEQQMALYQSHMALWASMTERMMGRETAPIAEPEKGDRRFKSDEWQSNMLFDYIKQSYLLTSQWMSNTIHNTEGMDKHSRDMAEFYTRQFLDLLDKPKVDSIENIRPSIAIEQTNTVKTSRSTVGTMTELTD